MSTAGLLDTVPFFGPMLGGLNAPAATLGEQAGNSACPINIPSTGELMSLLNRRLISKADYVLKMRSHGWATTNFDVDNLQFLWADTTGKITTWADCFDNQAITFRNLARLSGTLPSNDEVLEWLNKDMITYGVADVLLTFNGVVNRDVRRVMIENRFEIPGPSDLVRFAVREGFTPAIVQEYGYHKDFPKTILPWMDKQGYGQELGFNRPEGATDDTGAAFVGQATWSDLYWWSHWELPSTQQGYEMLHRLYPDSYWGRSPDAIDNITFGPDDLEKLQKTNDIPEYWRKRLQAISYLPLTRVDVRRMHKLGVLGNAAVYHAYRAAGYNDQNAQHLLDFTVESNRPAISKPKEKMAKDKVCEMYSLGLVTKEKAASLLEKLGFKLLDIADFLDNCELGVKLKKLKNRIAFLKKAYMKGMMGSNIINERLRAAGMPFEKAEELTDEWEVERLTMRKELSAKDALDWFKLGIINEDDLTSRLQLMHFDNVDISNMIKRAKFEVAQQFVKETVKVAKDTAKVADNAIKASVKAKEREIKLNEEMLNNILSASTPSQIAEWITNGTMSIDAARERLKLAKGWSTQDIDRFIYSKLSDAEEKQSGKTKNPPSPKAGSKTPNTTKQTGK